MNRAEIRKLNQKLKNENKKYCSGCNTIKNIDDFGFSKYHGRYESRCKKCKKEDQSKYYYEKYSTPENKLKRDLSKRDLRKCSMCNKIKKLGEFRLRKSGYYDSWCRECANKYAREKHLISERGKLRREGLRKCIKCGEIKKLEEFKIYKDDRNFMDICRKCYFKTHLKAEELYNSYIRLSNICGIEFTPKNRYIELKELKKDNKCRCFRCGEIKDLSEFRKGRDVCEECLGEYMRNYRMERSPNPTSLKRRRELKELMKLGKRRCIECGKVKKLEEFKKYQRQEYSWYDSRCDWCRTSSERKEAQQKELIAKGVFRCNKCGKIRKLDEFFKHKREKFGFEKICKYCRYEGRNKLRSTPQGKLNAAMSTGINTSLKNKKSGYHWENLVEYTLEDLMRHLESQFRDGMSWENYGEWHIDHIIPKSYFKFESPDDEEFKKCWSLENLQPLWASENIKKGNRLSHI